MANIDFAELAATLLRDAPRLVRQWLPNGKLEGREWCVGSVKGDKGRSFKVNIDKGTWADFAGTERGGDLISLYKEIHQLPSMLDAAKALAGVQDPSPKSSYTPKTQEIKDVIEVIPANLEIPKLNLEGFTYTKSWKYKDAEGQLIYVVQRYDSADGKKEIRPWRMVNGKLSSKQLPKPRPLYNLHEIARDKSKPIMIVEGEKAASAATVFGSYIPTTWPMGAQNVQTADWSALKDRPEVLIIPDADEAGLEAARWLGEHLGRVQKVGRISVVDTRKKPKGWDIADDADAKIPAKETGDFIRANVLSYEQFVARVFPENKPFMTEARESPSINDLDPIGVDQGPNPQIVKEANYENDLLINTYFRFLGFKNDRFFFYIYKTGQVIDMNSKMLGEEAHLVMLAPPDYWKETFENNFKAARVALVSISQEIRFNPRKVRKLGIWMDDEIPLAHLGEFIMTPETVMPLRRYKSRFVYEYSEHRVEFDELAPVATVRQATQLIEACSGSNWIEPTYGKILAGWMFMSLMCASVRWRSHLYIIGPAGSGKTWLLDNVVDKFFREFKLKAAGSSTEASIRQGLSNNMIPVIFDEAEAEDVNANMRRKAIFELARFASAATEDTPIVKGTSSANGGAREFFIRSPFLFASINASMDYADESRTTFLKLAPFDKDTNTRYKFKEHEYFVRKIMTRNYTCSMMRRAIQVLPLISESYELFVDALLQEIAADARQAEQMSYYVTGCWFLENDGPPKIEDAIRYVKGFVQTTNDRRNILSSEEKLISMISQIKIECDMNGRTVKRTVGELALLAQKFGKHEDSDKHYENAAIALKRAGMMVDNENSPYRFYVLNESTVVRAGLFGSSFYPTWDKVLSRVKGAKEHHDTRFLGSQGPSVSFPLKAFIGDINEFKKTLDNPF